FGLGFASYINNGDYDGYSVDVSEKYSKSVVAVSLGNTDGEKYEYRNSISEKYDKPYLYKNGGNFFYGAEVSQYTNNGVEGSGDWIKPIDGNPEVNSPYGNRGNPTAMGNEFHKGVD